MTPNQIGGKTNERLIQRRSVENLGEGRNKPTKTLQMQTFFLPFPFGTLLMQCRFTLYDEPKHTVLFQTTGQTLSIVLLIHSHTRTDGGHRR